MTIGMAAVATYLLSSSIAKLVLIKGHDSPESVKVRDFIYKYFQLAQSKEIEKIEEFFDPRFTKFGDSPPYDKRDFGRALMFEQLHFTSLSDYDFKIENLNTEIMGNVALATFLLEVTGMIVDDYSFRGTSVDNKSRVTIVLQKDKKDQWKMVHQHLSKLEG
ncbi:MAG: nuclear transport factor 2 family protein [Thermoproteota archaeon]|jgi:ketosteroid isomerase-like protein|nr:nuclear transport factor 2 family protein [Thermoproteota archaeon]